MSKKIHDLHDQRATELEAAKAITAKAAEEGRDLNDEETEAIQGHVNESKRLATEISEEETKEKERLALQADLNAEIEDTNRVQEPIVRPDPSRSSTPSIRPIRGEATGEFGHFGEYLFKVREAAIAPSVTDRRLTPTAAAPGMRTDVDSLGGFLIPDEFGTSIIERVYEQGKLLSRIKQDGFYGSLQRNTIKLPRVDETSRADGSRSGGVQGYWVGETKSITDSKPAIGSMTLTLHKAGAVGYTTDEMLEDSPIAGRFLERCFTNELKFTVENGIVNGNGSNKMLGLIASNCAVSVTKETNQTASTIWGPNVTKMWARMWAGCRDTAVWLVNQSCEPFLYSLTLEGRFGSGTTDVVGIPLYIPAGTALNQGKYGLLMGRPVIPVEYTQAIGTVGDIVLWDPASYVLVDKAGGINMASSMHVRFITDEETFRVTYRVDGQPTWGEPLTPYDGGDSLGPIVTLAERA